MTTDTPARRAADDILHLFVEFDWPGRERIAAIIEKHMAAPPPQPGTIAALLADGTITPETRVLGTLPMTADGAIVGDCGTVWVIGYGPDLHKSFVLHLTDEDVDRTPHGKPFVAWGGPGHGVELVQDCYSSKEAAEAARQKGTGDA